MRFLLEAGFDGTDATVRQAVEKYDSSTLSAMKLWHSGTYSPGSSYWTRSWDIADVYSEESDREGLADQLWWFPALSGDTGDSGESGNTDDSGDSGN